MNNDLLYNFISPITGRVLCDKDYVLVGNRQNIATPSPALIDLRLDIINIRQNLNQIKGIDFVIGHASTFLPNAQVLANLDVGYMYNNPPGTVTIKSSVDPGDLKLTWGHIFTGSLLGKASDTSVFPKNVLIGSDNPLFFGQAEFRIALHLENMAPLSTGKIWRGDAAGRPQEVDFPGGGGAPADATYVIIKPTAELPNATDLQDLAGGTFGVSTGGLLWTRGIADLRPFPPGTVGALRLGAGGLIPYVDDYVDPVSFDAYATEIEVQLLAIEAAIAVLESEVSALIAAVAVIQGQIIALFALAARPLNIIADNNPTSGDINFNQWKGYNVKDPTAGQDIVNLRTLVANIPTSIAAQSNTWYVDSLNGDDTYSGYIFAPFKTIQKAIDSTPANNNVAYTIYVSNGIYVENITMTNKRLTFKSAGNQNTLYNVFLHGTVFISFATSNLYFNTVIFEGFVFYIDTSPAGLVNLAGIGSASVTFHECKFNNLSTATVVTFIYQNFGSIYNLYLYNCKVISSGTDVGILEALIVKQGGLLDIFDCLFESSMRKSMIQLGSGRIIVKSSHFNSFYSDTISPSTMPPMIDISPTVTSNNNSLTDCYFTGAIASSDNKAAITVNNLANTVISFCYFSVRTVGSQCILYNSTNRNLQISSCYAIEGTAAAVLNTGVNPLRQGRAVGNCGDLGLTGDVTGFGSVPGSITTTMNLSLAQISLQNPTIDNVDFNLMKAINIQDPASPLDGVNLRTLEDRIGDIQGIYASIWIQGASTTVNNVTGIISQLDFSTSAPVGNLNFTSPTRNSIVYTGLKTASIMMWFYCTVQSSASSDINLTLYVNGSPQSPLIFSNITGVAGINVLINLNGGMTLFTGDVLTIWGATNGAPETWAIESVSWSAISMRTYP